MLNEMRERGTNRIPKIAPLAFQGRSGMEESEGEGETVGV